MAEPLFYATLNTSPLVAKLGETTKCRLTDDVTRRRLHYVKGFHYGAAVRPGPTTKEPDNLPKYRKPRALF